MCPAPCAPLHSYQLFTVHGCVFCQLCNNQSDSLLLLPLRPCAHGANRAQMVQMLAGLPGANKDKRFSHALLSALDQLETSKW